MWPFNLLSKARTLSTFTPEQLAEYNKSNSSKDDSFVMNKTLALNTDTYYSCLDRRCAAMLQLKPKVKVKGKYQDKVLPKRPNTFMTWGELFSYFEQQLINQGNIMAEVKTRQGKIQSIEPLLLNAAVPHPTYDHNKGIVELPYVSNDGTSKIHRFGIDKELLYIPANRLGHTGLYGLSMIQCNVDGLQEARSINKYKKRFWKNGSLVSKYLSTDQAFETEEAISRLRKSWNKQHGGLDNAESMPVLENGLKLQFANPKISAVDAEILATNKFNRESIAGMMGVPLALLSVGGEKVADISKIRRDFYSNTIHPHVTLIAEYLNEYLPEGQELILDPSLYIKGDKKEETELVKDWLEMSLVSREQAMDHLGLEEDENTDAVYVVQTNNTSLSSLEQLRLYTAENTNPTPQQPAKSMAEYKFNKAIEEAFNSLEDNNE